MSQLRIHLFGKLRVLRDGRLLDGFRGSKVQELLSYLLLYSQRAHPRETLASLLWADAPPASTKKYLRQALWHLQSALDCEATGAQEVLLQVDSEWIEIDPRAELWLDVAELGDAFERVRDIPGYRLHEGEARLLSGAIDLYTGHLLEGCYQDWCLFERERLEKLYLAMLDKLMGYSEVHQEYEHGLEYGMRILHLDHAQERTHRRMMRLHYLRRDRTAALRQFARCRRALDEELGVEPAHATLELYRQVQADHLETPPRPTPMADPGEARLAALRGLEEMRCGLELLLTQVQQQVSAVEQTLRSHG